jgi:RNA polymerase sigma factor (sigma-70 family)
MATVSAEPAATSDTELVDSVRTGDEDAFGELYRRYHRRIASFARGIVRDEARAEDVAQEAFISALRRLRATDSEIAFKPWIYEIARNAAIDSYRRTQRAEEVPMDSEDLLRPSDRGRLVGSAAPDSALVAKERLDHLRGALDELSDIHLQALVMRELEGLSYREIGERLELTRPAVESTLFRARRRLEREYEELDTGRRCEAMGMVIARLSNGVSCEREERRLARHATRCGACRKQARELGVEPFRRKRHAIVARAAALLPLPAFLRHHLPDAGGAVATGGQAAGAQLTVAVSERAAALVAAVALAGAGGAMLARVEPLGGQQPQTPASEPAAKRAPAPAAREKPSTRPEARRHARPSRSRAAPAAPPRRQPGPFHSSSTGGAAAPGASQHQRSAPAVPSVPPARPPADAAPKPPAGGTTGPTLPSPGKGLDSAVKPPSTPAIEAPPVGNLRAGAAASAVGSALADA